MLDLNSELIEPFAKSIALFKLIAAVLLHQAIIGSLLYIAHYIWKTSTKNILKWVGLFIAIFSFYQILNMFSLKWYEGYDKNIGFIKSLISIFHPEINSIDKFHELTSSEFLYIQSYIPNLMTYLTESTSLYLALNFFNKKENGKFSIKRMIAYIIFLNLSISFLCEIMKVISTYF